MVQTTNTLLLVRPSNFGYNGETALSNNFQREIPDPGIAHKARQEFDGVVKLLSGENIGIIVMDDKPADKTPDAIFPNNWVSFHEDGKVVLYPMEAPNRRKERRKDIIENVCEYSGIISPQIVDLSGYEKKGQYLEGTGSMVFDHPNRMAFMALSSRSHRAPLEELAKITGYKTFIFSSRDYSGQPVYHTNVLMSIGAGFAVICDACVASEQERMALLHEIELTGRQLITIDGNQMTAFAGNMLEVKNNKGDPYILLSQTALAAFTAPQRKTLEGFASLLPVSVPVIEKVGGGSVRCMVAEVFLRKGNENSNCIIKAPESASEFEGYYDLRWRVLRGPWNQPRGSERDEQESSSRHFMAITAQGKIIGAARLQEQKPGTAQLRYMAVDPQFHGKGIGKQLMQAVEKAAMETGYHTIFLQAREKAVPFYKATGYTILEKTFLLYNEIQHFAMQKRLVKVQNEDEL